MCSHLVSRRRTGGVQDHGIVVGPYLPPLRRTRPRTHLAPEASFQREIQAGDRDRRFCNTRQFRLREAHCTLRVCQRRSHAGASTHTIV